MRTDEESRKEEPWRTEPEIGPARQEQLTRCLAMVPDIKKAIYPFKGMKLSRADVEWLLATHENGRGPVDWSEFWRFASSCLSLIIAWRSQNRGLCRHTRGYKF